MMGVKRNLKNKRRLENKRKNLMANWRANGLLFGEPLSRINLEKIRQPNTHTCLLKSFW